jgi:poly(3-hydroxybutyrate) depolymerase
MKRCLIAVLVAGTAAAMASAAEKITKETLSSQGADRTFYKFVPDSSVGKAAPVVILLHGSGRDGRILVEHWQGLARKEGIILAGPDAAVRDGWGMREDGPVLLRDLVDALHAKHEIDNRRVYVFGHSAGAIHGIGLGIMESEYFAAVAVHAGVLPPSAAPYVMRAPRKIPIAIWVGTDDRLFPVQAVRASRDQLNERGYAVELTEIPRHTHDYYGRSSDINKAAWLFLKEKRLEKDPQYQHYILNR